MWAFPPMLQFPPSVPWVLDFRHYVIFFSLLLRRQRINLLTALQECEWTAEARRIWRKGTENGQWSLIKSAPQDTNHHRVKTDSIIQICSYLYSTVLQRHNHNMYHLFVLTVSALYHSRLILKHTWIPFRFTLLLSRAWSGKKNLLSSGDSSEVEESSASWPLAFGLEFPKVWEIMVMGRFLGKL